MKRIIGICMLILISFMVISCLNVDDEYDFDGNDFAYDVSVQFAPYACQPLIRDSVMLRAVTDSIVGSSSLRIVYDVDYDENEILIELIEIELGQIVRQDYSKIITNIGIKLNEDYSNHKLVFFSGDKVSTGRLNYNSLFNRFYLKPLNETNVSFNKVDIMAVR